MADKVKPDGWVSVSEIAAMREDPLGYALVFPEPYEGGDDEPVFLRSTVLRVIDEELAGDLETRDAVDIVDRLAYEHAIRRLNALWDRFEEAE